MLQANLQPDCLWQNAFPTAPNYVLLCQGTWSSSLGRNAFIYWPRVGNVGGVTPLCPTEGAKLPQEVRFIVWLPLLVPCCLAWSNLPSWPLLVLFPLEVTSSYVAPATQSDFLVPCLILQNDISSKPISNWYVLDLVPPRRESPTDLGGRRINLCCVLFG